MKVKKKSIFKGNISVGDDPTNPDKYLDYEISEWQCQLCDEWITMVTVDGNVLLGGGTWASDIDRQYCDKCSKIRIRAEKLFSK